MYASAQFVDDSDIKNKDTADIGCGFGSFVLNLIERQAKTVQGIEITKKDISTAKSHISDNRTTFLIGSAIDIPIQSQSVDTAVSWEVIEHIPPKTENKMFSEVNRILRSGGNFYLSTPFKSFWSCIADPAWLLIGHRHYSKKQLAQFAKNAGFRIEKMEARGGFWVLIAALNMYFSKWVLHRKPIFNEYFTKKDTSEYLKAGFATIFVKMHKVN